MFVSEHHKYVDATPETSCFFRYHLAFLSCDNAADALVRFRHINTWLRFGKDDLVLVLTGVQDLEQLPAVRTQQLISLRWSRRLLSSGSVHTGWKISRCATLTNVETDPTRVVLTCSSTASTYTCNANMSASHLSVTVLVFSCNLNVKGCRNVKYQHFILQMCRFRRCWEASESRL